MDFRFPVLLRGSELTNRPDELLMWRTRAYKSPELFGVLTEGGAHMTWRADPLGILIKLRSNMEAPGDITKHRLLRGNVSAADFVDELVVERGAVFRPDLTSRITRCSSWTPDFFRRNRQRFMF
jgi:hypothetical protein